MKGKNMSIGSINPVAIEQPKKASTTKKVLTAASVGAGVCAGIEAGDQYYCIKNAAKVFDKLNAITRIFPSNKERYNAAFKKLESLGISSKNAIRDTKKGLITGFKNLKIDWQRVGKAGLKGAAILTGSYFVCKGIMSLFNKA